VCKNAGIVNVLAQQRIGAMFAHKSLSHPKYETLKTRKTSCPKSQFLAIFAKPEKRRWDCAVRIAFPD